jgi:hypothetical protein
VKTFVVFKNRLHTLKNLPAHEDMLLVENQYAFPVVPLRTL